MMVNSSSSNIRAMPRALALLLLCLPVAAAAEVFLGDFREILHGIGGSAYALSDRVIEIRNFRYDGEGPAVYFWLDSDHNPSSGGFAIVSADNNPTCGKKIGYAADGTTTTRIELPTGESLSSYAGGSLSVWCEIFGLSFGELVLPSNLDALQSDDSVPLQCSTTPEDGDGYGEGNDQGDDNGDDNGDVDVDTDGGDDGGDSMMVVPEIAQTPENYNCEPLSDNLHLRWRVAGAAIDFELVGLIDDAEYMAFGRSGSPDEPRMIGGDVVMVYFDGDVFRARDLYLSSKSQCSNGIGACPDESFQFGGEAFNDAFNVRGDVGHGLTKIRYARPLKTTDIDKHAAGNPVDHNINIDEEVSIIWAIGPTNLELALPGFHHSVAREAKKIMYGRPLADNCEPLVTIKDPGTMEEDDTGNEQQSMAPTPAPIAVDPYGQRLIHSTETDLHARIGFSGGEARGYPAITGQPGWGISWYINDRLVPQIIMERGLTYRFHVNGGDNPDPSAAASYHPFYLTSSSTGGFASLNATERAQETVYAGIKFMTTNGTSSARGAAIEDGTFEPTAVGPLCLYDSTPETMEVIKNLNATYKKMFSTLDTSCANDTSITSNAGVFEFTPNASTPNTIYYQCVTHSGMGWKIKVRDPEGGLPPIPPPVSLAPTRAPSSAPVQLQTATPSPSMMAEPPLDDLPQTVFPNDMIDEEPSFSSRARRHDCGPLLLLLLGVCSVCLFGVPIYE